MLHYKWQFPLTLVCILMVLSGCGGNLPPPSTTSALDGKELYRGLFFGEGRVGQMMPEIWRGKSVTQRAQTPELAIRAKAFEDALINRLERDDPQFFNRFKEGLSGGDQLRVERVLYEGVQEFHRVINLDARTRGALLPDDDDDPIDGMDFFIYIADTLAISSDSFVVTEVALIRTSLVTVDTVFVTGSMGAASVNSGPQLQHDVMVGLIAQRFSRSSRSQP
jgi:SdpC family antimicrobial peptide